MVCHPEILSIDGTLRLRLPTTPDQWWNTSLLLASSGGSKRPQVSTVPNVFILTRLRYLLQTRRW